MKVLQLISSGGLYGAETMVVALSRRLKEMGHSSVIGIFHNFHSPNMEIADHARLSGVPVEIVRCNGKIDRRAMGKLRRLIQEDGIDAIHAHGYKADIYGYAARFGLHTPIVSTCHTWYDNDAALYLYGVLDRRILRRFDMAIAVSEPVAAELRKAGVAEKKIRIINNGIDLQLFGSSAATLRAELGADKKIIGAVARLAPEKGLAYLLKAAALVLSRMREVLFVIVGDGPERQQLENLAQELGISRHVIFTGARRDMPGVYASLDVLVQPSIKEGLPMTVLEALASKCPTIGTSVGAIPRVVIHEKTGLLVRPADSPALADAILRLLENADLRRQLAQAGHTWVRENFSIESMADSYLELYKSVARKKNGRVHN